MTERSNADVIADLIATAQPRTQEVRVCARGDLVDRHAALVIELGDATKEPGSVAGNPEVARLSEEIVAVEDEMEASTVTIVMQSIGRHKWANLLAAHPPRKQDREDHNPESFPPAMVAACCQSPPMTEEQSKQLAEVLPTGEWAKLWMAGITLNVTETPHPKLVAATELVRANAASSTTRPNAASPGPSSSASNAAQ